MVRQEQEVVQTKRVKVAQVAQTEVYQALIADVGVMAGHMEQAEVALFLVLMVAMVVAVQFVLFGQATYDHFHQLALDHHKEVKNEFVYSN
jgi:hypothetical protein